MVVNSQKKQLGLVQAEEKEMLEAKTLPLRNYLMCHVMPTVTQGLIEVCKTKPEDPVDYLVGIYMYHDSLLAVCINFRGSSSPHIVFSWFLQAEYLFKHNPQID